MLSAFVCSMLLGGIPMGIMRLLMGHGDRRLLGGLAIGTSLRSGRKYVTAKRSWRRAAPCFHADMNQYSTSYPMSCISLRRDLFRGPASWLRRSGSTNVSTTAGRFSGRAFSIHSFHKSGSCPSISKQPTGSRFRMAVFTRPGGPSRSAWEG
jgi:hypothetical protein